MSFVAPGGSDSVGAAGYMLENPSIPHYLVTSEATFTMVTT